MKLSYNHNTHTYVALIEDGLIHVDADHLETCLHQDEDLDREIYDPQTWIPFIGGEFVQKTVRPENAC